MEENLKRIEELKTFMGGDNEDVPVFPKAIEDMKYIVKQCEEYSLPQPDIFPWAGGNGVQAQWETDWYIEIDSSSTGVEGFVVKGKEYDKATDIKFKDVENAFFVIKDFIIKYIVNSNEGRR